MLKLIACFACIVICARAASITAQVSCDALVTIGQCLVGNSAVPDFSFASASAGSSSVQAIAESNIGHFASAIARFQDDFVFTVTSGPEHGFFLPCFSQVGQDYFQGTAFASAQFGTASFSVTGRSFSSVCGLYGAPPMSFTLGVPETYTELLSASVSVGSLFANFAQGQASASFTGFSFFDSALHPVSAVTYSLVEVAAPQVPEPAGVFLLLSGLVAFACLRRTGAACNMCGKGRGGRPGES